MKSIHVRRLRASDSLDELTSLLHRSFGPLGRLGLPCTCVGQSVEVTRQRARRGECYVAFDGDRLVGTMTLERPDGSSDCATYRRSHVASLHQFAVDPVAQGQGCGETMLRFAQRRARELGYCTLALDTPSRAAHLLSFYQSQGFRRIAEFRKADRPYWSTVLGKTVSTSRRSSIIWSSPHRHFSLAAFRAAPLAGARPGSTRIDLPQRPAANAAEHGPAPTRSAALTLS
jgi:GNAT superfamily N-acetyltransferase